MKLTGRSYVSVCYFHDSPLQIDMKKGETVNELHLLLEEMLTMDLEQLIISNPKSKETNITKIKIRPVNCTPCQGHF